MAAPLAALLTAACATTPESAGSTAATAGFEPAAAPVSYRVEPPFDRYMLDEGPPVDRNYTYLLRNLALRRDYALPPACIGGERAASRIDTIELGAYRALAIRAGAASSVHRFYKESYVVTGCGLPDRRFNFVVHTVRGSVADYVGGFPGETRTLPDVQAGLLLPLGITSALSVLKCASAEIEVIDTRVEGPVEPAVFGALGRQTGVPNAQAIVEAWAEVWTTRACGVIQEHAIMLGAGDLGELTLVVAPPPPAEVKPAVPPSAPDI